MEEWEKLLTNALKRQRPDGLDERGELVWDQAVRVAPEIIRELASAKANEDEKGKAAQVKRAQNAMRDLVVAFEEQEASAAISAQPIGVGSFMSAFIDGLKSGAAAMAPIAKDLLVAVAKGAAVSLQAKAIDKIQDEIGGW